MRTRGQTLVLFALTLLLLTLMVLMTLSFGAKVKSRMELQTTADAATYSNAVATARTLNSIAVMNRVTVAHTVSTIGTLSLISWVTLYWKHAKNARDLWTREAIIFALGFIYCICPGPTCNPVACRACRRGVLQTGIAAGLMWHYAGQIRDKLRTDTALFANETAPRWQASIAMFADQTRMHATLLTKLNSPAASFANRFSTQGNLPGVTGNAAPAALNARDLDTAIQPIAVNDRNKTYATAQIVNASRGHPFVPDRDSGTVGGILSPWAVKLSFPWSIIAAGWVFTDGSGTGLGYLNNNWVANIPGPALGHHYGSWANDWGDRTRVLLIKPYGPMCPIFGTAALIAGLLGKSTGNNEVQVGPFDHPGIHNGVQHSYRTFPPFYDYNTTGLIDRDDLYAVPKNMSMISADPRVRNDPWDMRGGNSPSYNFKFSTRGSGARLDYVTDRKSVV